MRSSLGTIMALYPTASMYKGLNTLSKQGLLGAGLARIGSIPVTLIDYTLEMLKEPIMIIENIISIAVNLIGCSFSKKCSLYDAGLSVYDIIWLPDRLLTKTIRLIPRLFINLFSNTIHSTLYGLALDKEFWILYYNDDNHDTQGIL